MPPEPTYSLEQISKGRLQEETGKLRHIVRFLPTPDVGIDGDIEFCQEGRPTGARLAFQLKAGPSYISSINETEIRVRIESKHLRYWCCVNLPVLLIYYHQETNSLVWIGVKEWLLQSAFDPTSQESTAIPILRSNTITSSTTDIWRRILSIASEVDKQLRDRMVGRIPELALFEAPRRLSTRFFFTADRSVIVDNFGSTDWTLIEVPEDQVPPDQLTTTLLTIFSCGDRSNGSIRTQLGWPEIPFDTFVNDTVPIEVPLLFRSFQVRLDPRSHPVKIVAKGYGMFL